MAIELTEVASGYSTGVINDNFEAIEAYINDNLLNRDGTTAGEVNQLELDIDVNNHRLFNLPLPINSHEAARLIDVQNAIEGDTAANLISFTPTAPYTSDTVQGAIESVQFVDTSTGTDQPLADALDDRATKALTQGGTVAQALKYVTPYMFGGVGDGVADDTTPFQNALSSGYPIDARHGTWRITSTLTLSADTMLDIESANIVAECGATPIFSFGAAEGLAIKGGAGGVISGTASAFLECTGASPTPASAADYSRKIYLTGIHVSDSNITKTLSFVDAVRQVFIDRCHFFTPSGIEGNGKSVEIMVHKSIIFSSTGAAGTKGLHLHSSAGTNFYNEGWHITDCTIDNFEMAFDVSDLFVMTVSGGYIGGAANTDYAFYFRAPTTTTHTREINIGDGAVLSGKIAFDGATDFRALVSGLIMTGIDGLYIDMLNSADGIKVSSVKFVSSSSGIAVRIRDGSSNCHVNDVSCDFTFTAGVSINGASGGSCSVSNIDYAGSGNALFTERAVKTQGIPVQNGTVVDEVLTLNTDDIAGTFAVSDTIESVSVDISFGQTGWVIGQLGISGAAADQRLRIDLPSGLINPSGAGWNSRNITRANDGHIAFRIPVYANSTITAGTLALVNDQGNSITVDSHGIFGFERSN